MTPKLELDDLDGQAHAIWRLGEQLCGDHCRSYHQLRGVLMNTSGVQGGRHDAETLKPLIGALATPGSRILIAGAADAGLLRTVLAGALARPLSITIVDLCPTPLALIDGLLSPPGVSVSTEVADLTQPLPAHFGQFDLVFSHSMLPFVPPTLRGAVLETLKGALATGGKLVVAAILSPEMTSEGRLAARQKWFERVLAAIGAAPRMNALAGEAKTGLLRDYADRFRYSNNAFTSPDEVRTVLEANGLEVEEQLHGGELRGIGSMTGARSAIFVATPSLPPA